LGSTIDTALVEVQPTLSLGETEAQKSCEVVVHNVDFGTSPKKVAIIAKIDGFETDAAVITINP
jgi:hypothetical protein